MERSAVHAALSEALRAGVAGCHARASEGDDAPPIVLCARHKALVVDAELNALAVNEEATLVHLEVTRVAAIAAGRLERHVAQLFETRTTEVRAAAATKRVALQMEAVAVDAALEGALAAVAALIEAIASPDDAELTVRAPALLTREAAARAAVAAIPAYPLTSGFLCMSATPATPMVMRAAALDALFGRVLAAPLLPPHVHTPHCDPACPIRSAPHEHSASCNHAPAPKGTVFAAAERGDVAALEAAIAAGGSTEEADSSDITALSYAAGYGYLDAVCVLITAGADVAATSRWQPGHTPLYAAAANGHAAVTRLLLDDPRVDPNAIVVFSRWSLPQGLHFDDQKWGPLHGAAYNGHLDIVQLLVSDSTVDVNAGSNISETPLHCATYCGHRSVMRLLLGDPRVDPVAKDKNGRTPLHRAANAGFADIVSLLLSDPRVDVRARDAGGWTPLHCAARCGAASAVRLLLADPRVDVHAKAAGDGGTTAWDLARRDAPRHAQAAVVALLERSMGPIVALASSIRAALGVRR